MRLLPSRSSRPDPLDSLRRYAGVQVRGGYLTDAQLLADLEQAVADDLDVPDAGAVADRLLTQALADAHADQQHWPALTDHARLCAAFDRLRADGIDVLEAVEDHWSATAWLKRLADADTRVRGIAWFTLTDVWHAVEHGMLEVNLWHRDSANVAPGDALLDRALPAFATQGLAAHFDEGRIEVAARWQRRP